MKTVYLIGSINTDLVVNTPSISTRKEIEAWKGKTPKKKNTVLGVLFLQFLRDRVFNSF